jgi:hypothetical protein
MGHEQFFICPYCHQNISVILDLSIEGSQEYIEDCEVCCRPIQIQYQSNGEELEDFSCHGIQSDLG